MRQSWCQLFPVSLRENSRIKALPIGLNLPPGRTNTGYLAFLCYQVALILVFSRLTGADRQQDDKMNYNLGFGCNSECETLLAQFHSEDG